MQFIGIVLTAVVTAGLWTALLQHLARRFASSPPDISELLLGCGVGLIAGLLLACSARCGSAPRLRARFFVRKMSALLCFVAFAAGVGGAAGYLSAKIIGVRLWDPHFAEIPRAAHPAFLAVFVAGLFSIIAAVGGSALLACFAAKVRRQARSQSASTAREES